MENLFQDLAKLRRQGQDALVATVVRTYGSAYRREGAGALLTPDGVAAGAISGGCLESDLLEATRGVLAGEPPRLLDYDTSLDDDDLIWGTGTGCGGRVQVLLAPVPDNVLAVLEQAMSAGRPAVVCTIVVGPGPGARLAVADAAPAGGSGTSGSAGSAAGSLGAPALDARFTAAAADLLAAGGREPQIWAVTPDGRVLATAGPRQPLPALPANALEVLVQPVYPPPILLVCGAGDDAVPLAAFGAAAGFRVVVADHRPAYADPARFPGAVRVLRAHPDELPGLVDLGPDTYAILITHNFQKDQQLLRVLLEHPITYVGLLGARERSRRLVEMMRDQGGLPADAVQRLYTPVGLDIGADGPAEIAISVLAEVLAARSGRPGVPLRQSRPVLEHL